MELTKRSLPMSLAGILGLSSSVGQAHDPTSSSLLLDTLQWPTNRRRAHLKEMAGRSEKLPSSIKCLEKNKMSTAIIMSTVSTGE
jgi:hypothetical protein